jgi:hypothetical protein
MVPALWDGAGVAMPETQLHAVPPVATGKLPDPGNPAESVCTELAADATTMPSYFAASSSGAVPTASAGQPESADAAASTPEASSPSPPPSRAVGALCTCPPHAATAAPAARERDHGDARMTEP